MRVRRFSEVGLNRFSDFLDDVSAGSTSNAPADLLTDDACATIFTPETAIDPNRAFPSRLEAATYLCGLFGNLNVEKDAALWAWMSLLYFDQLCPRGPAGARAIGERARYFPEVNNFQKYYRHLILGPYIAFRAHREQPDRALAVLQGPLDSPGELVEQLVSTAEIVTNPNVIELATKLYINLRDRRPKRGSGGKGPGSVRRLKKVLNQLDMTWDLQSMTWQVISGKLPREFDRFKHDKMASALT